MSINPYEAPTEPDVAVQESRQFTLIPLLFAVFFLLLNFQTITYLGLENEDLEATKASDSQIRYYHFFALVFVLPLLRWLPSLRIPLPAIIYFVCATATTLFASYTSNHFSNRTITLFFAGYCFLLGLYFAHVMNAKWMETTVRNLFLFFQLAVLAKLLFYMAQAGGGLPRNIGGRPNILFYSAGGNNLEVTWLALSSVFFLRQISFYPITGNCLLTSVMYLSRVGVLVTGVAAAYRMIRVRPALTVLVLGTLGPLLLIIFASTINWRASEMVDRFVSIGDKEEYGSQSRMDLWIAAADAVRTNPWGYGIGTGMEVVKDIMGETVHQNNVHNIFLQIALDCGVQSLLCFLFLMFDIGRKWWLRGGNNPYGTFVLLFLLPGMIEFTGQEALTWMFVGMFYGTIDVPTEAEDLEAEKAEYVQDDEEEEGELVEAKEKPEPVVAVVDRPM